MLINTPKGPLEIAVDVLDLPPTFPIILPLCRELNIAQIVDEACPMKAGKHLTHGQVAEFLLLHILQSSKRLPLYKLQDWAAEHNIHQLYGHQAKEFNDDRIGRTLDAISQCIEKIETAVVRRALARYPIDARTLHWDLTHVDFSDARKTSELVCPGYGDGQINQRQVQVSLYTTSDGGLPVMHTTLSGNVHQAPLAAGQLEQLQTRLGRTDLTVVSDRAGISYDNIVAYREADTHFLGALALKGGPVYEPLGAVAQGLFQPLDYQSINSPEDVNFGYVTSMQLKTQTKKDPIGVDALFIFNPRLQAKDANDRQKKLDKALKRLAYIGEHLNQRQYKNQAFAQRQVSKAVPDKLKAIVQPQLTADGRQLALQIQTDHEALAQSAVTDGRWILLYDLPDSLSADDIFRLYRRQDSIEMRFRHFNSDLSVHPMWLQKDSRLKALLLIHVLALIIYALLERGSEQAGLDTEHYPKMTTREMMYRFGKVRIKQVRVAGQRPVRELVLTETQRHILRRMNFPDPMLYVT
jgi:transposase